MPSIEYFAGFFDGEGCIFGPKPHKRDPVHRVRIHIGHTYKPILEEFRNSYGGSIYNYNRIKGRKQVYDWHLVDERHVTRFLLDMEPLLREKQAQARIALDMLSIRYSITGGNLGSLSKKLAELKHAIA